MKGRHSAGRGGGGKASRDQQFSRRGHKPSQPHREGTRARHPPERGRPPAGPSEFRPAGKERWVVGIHSAAEALRVRPKKIREIWFREDFESAHQLRELAKQAEESGVPVKHRSLGQLDAIGSGHQGVALAVTENPELDWEQLKGPEPRIILILDGIEDPHNLGSMLRTGWLTGVAGILIPEDRAVGLTPSVCKVASGGAEHVPVESFTNIPSAIQDLKNAGFWVYGLSEKGVRKPWEFKLPEKVAWIVGSEGGGMRITTERACDELVKIPQVESGSSYNAAVAMAMALAETCRQFGKPE